MTARWLKLYVLFCTIVMLSAWQITQPQSTVVPASSLTGGLSFVSPELDISSAGNGSGVLGLKGTTDGIAATFTAPASAGTRTNPVVMTNVLQGPAGANATPTYSFSTSTGSGMSFNSGTLRFTNGGTIIFSSSGTVNLANLPICDTTANNCLTWASGLISTTGSGTPAFSANSYQTISNCSSSASPAVCGSAAAGSVVIAAAATSVTVNTTAVTANSQIFIQPDDSLGTKLSVTCNTTGTLLDAEAWVSARVAATSFTITVNAAPSANPECFSYFIVN